MQLNVPVKPLLIGLFGVVVGIGLAVGPRHVPRPHPAPPPPPAPAPKPAPDVRPDWFGLRYTPGARALIASMPKLAQAAPGLMAARDASDGRPILLYRAWTDLFRAYPPYPAQEIGDCVSFGHGHALDLLQCIEWCLKHPGRTPLATDIQEADTEFIYAASREVGGMLGGQDGSYGAAAVKAMTTVGVVSRRMLGPRGAYDGRRAKQWGRTGAPAAVKAMAARYKLGAAAAVTTWDELVAALHAGHPVTICTARGFTLTRDPQGFCKARGQWGHCMFIAGARFDRPGACIVQSWGEATPSGPTGLDQPPYSFWADKAVVEAILAEGDSWALSAAPRFGAAGRKRSGGLPDAWRKAG